MYDYVLRCIAGDTTALFERSGYSVMLRRLIAAPACPIVYQKPVQNHMSVSQHRRPSASTALIRESAPKMSDDGIKEILWKCVWLGTLFVSYRDSSTVRLYPKPHQQAIQRQLEREPTASTLYSTRPPTHPESCKPQPFAPTQEIDAHPATGRTCLKEVSARTCICVGF